MKQQIITCDLCKKRFEDVNTSQKSGRGRLVYDFTFGNGAGGFSNNIKYEDLCVNCSEDIRKILHDWEKSRKVEKA